MNSQAALSPPLWKIVLRWLAFLPGAVVATLLVNVVLRLIYRLATFLNGMNPDGFLSKLWLEVMAGALAGAAFVYAGSMIAPSHRKEVSYALAFIIVLIGGAMGILALGERNWWALVGCIVSAAGGAYVAHAVATGEISLDT